MTIDTKLINSGGGGEKNPKQGKLTNDLPAPKAPKKKKVKGAKRK